MNCLTILFLSQCVRFVMTFFNRYSKYIICCCCCCCCCSWWWWYCSPRWTNDQSEKRTNDQSEKQWQQDLCILTLSGTKNRNRTFYFNPSGVYTNINTPGHPHFWREVGNHIKIPKQSDSYDVIVLISTRSRLGWLHFRGKYPSRRRQWIQGNLVHLCLMDHFQRKIFGLWTYLLWKVLLWWWLCGSWRIKLWWGVLCSVSRSAKK
jgi:hypothetical protein